MSGRTKEITDRTNNWQGWSSPQAATGTNTISLTTGHDETYIRNVVSTNTVTRIDSGPIAVNTYIFKTGAGTVSVAPEVYAYDTVAETLVELGAAPEQAITATSPTLYTFSISVTGTNFANANKIVWAWKVKAVTVTPDISFVSGGQYDSHLSFVQNLGSATINASQIVGAGNLIYSNAADPAA